jgi:hypothetical protein
MGIGKQASQQLLSEFTKSEVIAEFYDITGDFGKVCPVEKVDRLGSKETIWENVRPCSITINQKFTTPIYVEIVDPKYKPYLESLRGKVFEEIDNNINLRIGKWDIIDYLANLEFDLKEIRNKIENIYVEEVEDYIFKNSNIKVNIIGNLIRNFEIEEMDIILSQYWEIQITEIEYLLRVIITRKNIIEKTDDYVKQINSLPPISILQWKRSDTDLLELIVALNKSGSIYSNNSPMTRKQTIEFFETLFAYPIKDAESKLSRATERKDPTPYLSFLKQTFENYVRKKLE